MKNKQRKVINIQITIQSELTGQSDKTIKCA